MPKETVGDYWPSSKGRKLLIKDIRSGRIPADMAWEDAYKLRPEFVVGTKEDNTAKKARSQFESRLDSAREILAKRDTRAAEELALLRQDRQRHPAPATNHKGEPRWEGSEAQKLLKQDVAEKKHEGMKPAQYYASRPQYKAWGFSAATIKGHVEQEVKLLKFRKQMRGKFGYGGDY
jgi:hypothetical protein